MVRHEDDVGLSEMREEEALPPRLDISREEDHPPTHADLQNERAIVAGERPVVAGRVKNTNGCAAEGEDHPLAEPPNGAAAIDGVPLDRLLSPVFISPIGGDPDLRSAEGFEHRPHPTGVIDVAVRKRDGVDSPHSHREQGSGDDALADIEGAAPEPSRVDQETPPSGGLEERGAPLPDIEEDHSGPVARR